jgi:acetolactate synthase-1/2/3 large subunit
VTGFGGSADVAEKLAHVRATLVLGTRLGELTSFWDPDLVPPEGFVHVDLDRGVPGRAYPNAPTLAVQAEIGAFTRALLDALGPRPRRNKIRSSTLDLVREIAPRRSELVRPTVLMAAIQRRVVEGSSALVMTEAGNAFAWGTHCLRFDEPGRYRVSTGFGSMGQATAGVVGAALARGKAVAIVGDGAMLMNCEISTAVQYGAPAVWIVLNDRRYGMIAQGMRAQGWSPLATDIPHTRFATIARAMGAEGVEVGNESELGAALDRALTATRPFVVDVAIDPDELAPIGNRIRNLMNQGAKGSDNEESAP